MTVVDASDKPRYRHGALKTLYLAARFICCIDVDPFYGWHDFGSLG